MWASDYSTVSGTGAPLPEVFLQGDGTVRYRPEAVIAACRAI